MTQERYSRQILFKDIGEHGQQTINQKHVLIVGMGALGTHVAEGLVRAGIRELTIVDRDYICLLYTSPSPRDLSTSRMPSSA